MRVLNGWRIMWIIVMFDLPVGSPGERKAATKFREFLLDQGFSMNQFSVYFRCCASRELVDRYLRRVQEQVPEGGRVDVLCFTDKQYENMKSFYGKRKKKPKKQEQYLLF